MSVGSSTGFVRTLAVETSFVPLEMWRVGAWDRISRSQEQDAVGSGSFSRSAASDLTSVASVMPATFSGSSLHATGSKCNEPCSHSQDSRAPAAATAVPQCGECRDDSHRALCMLRAVPAVFSNEQVTSSGGLAGVEDISATAGARQRDVFPVPYLNAELPITCELLASEAELILHLTNNRLYGVVRTPHGTKPTRAQQAV